MSEWAAKRFWKDAAAERAEGGYTVLLDGRNVRTPAKALLILPNRKMADAIAAEWAAQGERIDPMQMPVTRSANAAIDKVATQRDEVIEMLAEYGATDLLCYRAEAPEELVSRQAAAWDPLLDWADAELSARLMPVQGVMFHAQRPESLAKLRTELDALTPFQLAAAHDLISISGSLVLACAVMRGETSPEDAWAAARIDETWQEEQWGVDEEARVMADAKRNAFLHAAYFFGLSDPSS
ncbi:ATP12 family chaperone protein [Aliiroseovarius sp. YM-037]|uniref:ATP12 family chaperone protein n=1 Tax=Aliiroseovarius sp. YM-037 TaxID=3341728 RepID=UPI003A7FAE20